MKNVTIKFGLQALARQFADDATISTIIRDSSVKAYLGYGDNVRTLMNGYSAEPHHVPRDGSILQLETLANSKAAPDTILIRFGLNTAQKQSDRPITAGDITSDMSLKAALGFSDATRVTLNGVALSDDSIIPNGATVVLETMANTKAN